MRASLPTRKSHSNAGTHRQLLRMDWADLVKLVEPRILQITKERVAEFVA